jgi:XTP/dITP diphosphohydrolase
MSSKAHLPLARGTKLVVATHNPGKLSEIRDLIEPFGMAAVSAGELGLTEPEETGTTFAANAILKAAAAANASGLPALSDDSGLAVDALGGDPGIYSARWAGPTKDFSIAMARVADELQAKGAWDTKPGPAAQFVCALCLAFPDGTEHVFEGIVEGHLVWPARGTRGFGYDPMFVPEGGKLSFGEMEAEAKHAISHRARAFALFKARCLG